jgi:hypothetical protein
VSDVQSICSVERVAAGAGLRLGRYPQLTKGGSDSSAGESLAGRRGNSNLGASGGLRHGDVSELAHKATHENAMTLNPDRSSWYPRGAEIVFLSAIEWR